MTFPGHYSGKTQIGSRRDDGCKRNDSLTWLDATTMHTGVNLHNYPGPRSRHTSSPVQLCNTGSRVDRNDHIRNPAQFRKPRDLFLPNDLICDQDVANTALGHDLGFTDFRARDADCTRGYQALCERRHLDALGVRAPRHPCLSKCSRHPLNVAFERIEVDKQCGRIEFIHGQV